MNSSVAHEGVLLVIGIGSQKDRDSRPYREPLLAAAAERFPVWLFDSDEPTWQKDYTVGATALDCYDPQALVKEARRLAELHPIVGVLCPDEGTLAAASHVTEELGFPGLSVESARACRDKKISRSVLTEAGIAQPGFTTARNWQEALAAAERFGFPVVLKPRTLGSSQGVVMVKAPEEIEGAFHDTSRAAYPGVHIPDDYVVEQYLSGPEVSIDGVVFDGVYTPAFVARKQIGPEPFFTEMGHVVTAEDEILTDTAVRSMLQDAHTALGVTHGTTHSEVKLTPQGPVIVEINGRPGGDILPYLGRLAGGVDTCLAAVDAITGRPPTIRPTRSGSAGIRFFAPTEPCQVREVRVGDTSTVPGLVRAAPLVSPGAELLCPPEDTVARFGYVIVEGASYEECAERLELADGLITLDGEPLRTTA